LLVGEMVHTPALQPVSVAGMAKTIVSPATAFVIAVRSEPAPVLAVDVTVSVAAYDFDTNENEIIRTIIITQRE
jgi:hypothetical protein